MQRYSLGVVNLGKLGVLPMDNFNDKLFVNISMNLQ